MDQRKKQLHAFLPRVRAIMDIATNTNAGAWSLIVLILTVQISPYPLSLVFPIPTGVQMGLGIGLSMVSLVLAAFLRARKGAFFVWLVDCIVVLLLDLFDPVMRVPDWQQTYVMTSIGVLIMALVAGQMRNLGLRLKQAYTTLQAAHVELEEAHATIQKQALTDGLTGLPNHRAIMEQLRKEMERARRYQRTLSILFFDADRFKRVNDTYGHGAGDAVLRQIGERAASVIRGEDTIGRFGGEEFVILLPETEQEEAKAIAERIRTTVAAGPVATAEVEGGISATISIGLSTYAIDGEDEQTLLSQADEAMYVAKRMGRNQVRTAEEARRIGEDAELLALLQEAGQGELAQREGLTPEQLRETYTLRMIYSLLSLLEHRDEGQNVHAHAVSDLATAISHEMGLAAHVVFRVGLAALLHDIGKVAMPDKILQKANTLTAQECSLLAEHTVLGAQILEGSPFLTDLAPAVRHHHEQWNGKGYPDGLRGENIPLPARIIAVAEAYDTLRGEHVSQAGSSAELQRCAGTRFDPTVVQLLTRVLSNQPEKQHQISGEESVGKGYSLSGSF